MSDAEPGPMICRLLGSFIYEGAGQSSFFVCLWLEYAVCEHVYVEQGGTVTAVNASSR
jgi:hypothetical protein